MDTSLTQCLQVISSFYTEVVFHLLSLFMKGCFGEDWGIDWSLNYSDQMYRLKTDVRASPSWIEDYYINLGGNERI